MVLVTAGYSGALGFVPHPSLHTYYFLEVVDLHHDRINPYH